MNDGKLSIRQFIEKFVAGTFDNADVKTQIDAGWYDWFCRDASLKNKTKKMGNIIKQLEDGGKVDLDKMYVFFKNNCGSCGLYDCFKICDIETGKVMFCIECSNPANEHRYEVHGGNLDYNLWPKTPYSFDTSKALVRWLNQI